MTVLRPETEPGPADATTHPFGRHLPPVGDQLVFDDGAASGTVLIAFANVIDNLGIPAAEFFELVDHQVRRIYIRKLIPTFYSDHPLGDTVEDIQRSLREMTAGHSHIVVAGTSAGGYLALLYGTLLNAAAIVVGNPTTTVSLDIRASLGDHRTNELVPPEFRLKPVDAEPAEFDDIPTLWQTHPPRRVIVNYRYRQAICRAHAEHLAGTAGVQLIPHYESRMMQHIAADGQLRQIMDDVLNPLKTGGRND